MKHRFDLTCLAVIGLFAFPISGYALTQGDDLGVIRGTQTEQAMRVEGRSAGASQNYILAKAGGGSALAACKAQCRTAYRRCYSQGNQVGKPYVTGGEPCSEQKVMCMRACQQQ